MTQKQAWGEDRVYVRDASGELQHIPLGWTSAAPPNAFQAAAARECRFTTDDLLRLADLVGDLTGGAPDSSVKAITPQSSDNYAGRLARRGRGAKRGQKHKREHKSSRHRRRHT